jgi:alpha-L-rhamnosidase
LTSSCYYYVDATLVSRFAEITGHKEDQAYYTQLAEDIKAATNKRFLDNDKAIYANGSQTAQSAAIYQDVVPEEYRKQVAENLVKAVHANNDHLDVGLLGSKYLLNALTDTGYAELAYKVASQETRPSWGWWIVNGATTFQEGWGMGPSRNHVFMGEILAWFYKTLAGIRIDPMQPGFKHIIIKPHFVEGLSYVKAKTNSVHGEIRSEWEKSGDNIKLDLTIPANTKAMVYLPVVEGKNVYESGKLVDNSSQEIRYIDVVDTSSRYEIKAGRYQIEIK